MEFVIKNRRFRLVDGVIMSRTIATGGKETKKESWKAISFFRHNKGYEQCELSIDGQRRKLLKHRLMYLAHNPSWDILNGSKDNSIDHINRTRSDNRVDNLRVVTHQQNQFNRSNTKGYYWAKNRSKWRAQLVINGRTKHLGYYKDKEDARAAYLEGKKIYHKFDNGLTSQECEEIDEYNASF